MAAPDAAENSATGNLSPVLTLLPSPLLGPVVWEPVAGDLDHRGWPVATTRVEPTAPQTPGDALRRFLSAVPADRDVILVPHSNAGLFVPALVSGRQVVGAVFVDAGLPPRQGEVPLAPPALLDALTGKADDRGVLPPWTGWWEETDLSALFPGPEARARVEAEQQRLQLSYFSATLPVPSGWDDGLPAAYLAFGDTYADERARAADLGWPTATLPGHHLHLLMDPEAVAAQIHDLLSRLGLRPGRQR